MKHRRPVVMGLAFRAGGGDGGCFGSGRDRAEKAIAAAEAGVRGIYVEEPFSQIPAEAHAMIVSWAKPWTRIAVAHRMRTHPVLPVVKKLILEGLIGDFFETRGEVKRITVEARWTCECSSPMCSTRRTILQGRRWTAPRWFTFRKAFLIFPSWRSF